MEGSVDVVEVLKVFGRYRFETLGRLPTVFIKPIDHVFHGLTFIHEAANFLQALRNREGSKFINNTGPFGTFRGGIVAIGADAIGLTNVASDNTVLIRLGGCTISGNQNKAFSTAANAERLP